MSAIIYKERVRGGPDLIIPAGTTCSGAHQAAASVCVSVCVCVSACQARSREHDDDEVVPTADTKLDTKEDWNVRGMQVDCEIRDT